MIEELGYPKGLLAVEKRIVSLSGVDPERRIDIVCFVSASQGLRPILLIECKAETLDEQAEMQAFGYNASIGAPFIALASAEGVKTFWKEKERIVSVPFLPSFHELVKHLDDAAGCKI